MKKIIKNYFISIIIAHIIIFIPLVIGLILWARLPEELPMHYNLSGDVDSYSGKVFGVLFGPVFSFLMYWLLMLLIAVDEKRNKNNIVDNSIVMILIMFIMPCVSIYIGFLVYGNTLGISINSNTASLLLIGLFLLVLGNYLPKSRPNTVFGMRLPWIINDADNWIRTNRFTGLLMILLGLLMIIDAFIQIRGELGTCLLIFGGLILVVIISIFYSLCGRKNYEK